MAKKTIKDINVKNKRVIHHCDFNIKLYKNSEGELVPKSDVRLKAYFPSIFYLLNEGAKIIFISYLERPGGKVVEEWRMKPVALRLSQLINRQVHYLPYLIEPQVKKFIEKMKPGEMVMLENTRFYPGEEEDDDKFAQKLADLGDLMVEDAFGHCHRVHASVTGIPRHLPTVAGFYLKGEMDTFNKLMHSPQKPLLLIIGGSKTYDKILAMEKLIKKTDYVLVGGAAAHNFLKAKNIALGNSLMEEPYVDKAKGEKIDLVELAGKLLEKYKEKIILPFDLLAADDLQKPKKTKVIDLNKEKIPNNWAFADLGPKTIKKFLNLIQKAKTIFWDGPLGKYEEKKFRNGSLTIAEAVAENKGTTILAGGDTAALAEDFGLIFRYSHVSIAGGAALEYLAGKELPGIKAIKNK